MSVDAWRFRALLRRLATVFTASCLPLAAWAVCTCGFGDGAFTLAPIGVDGNLADWAPIHADLDNNTCDGPSGGVADRDAPVQSTGRDLSHFAFTWDESNIYLFTERVGSTSNQQSFAYYADTDNDELMETGEPVIGVTWAGNNRRINVYVFTYVSQAAGGDPMVDGNGFGDGYTLPGSFANVPPTGSPNRSGTWGSVDGLQMEFYVTWAELGVAPNTPFTFHVASSNASLGASSFTAQVDDNLSGCGGGLGSTAVRGVTFTPDRSLTGFPGETAVAIHTLTNIGNAPDEFDMRSVGSGDFMPTIRYYEDVDGSATVTPADTLLVDSDGDGDPDTRTLSASETIAVLIAYDVPAGATAGDGASIITTAASDFQPLVNDGVTDIIDVFYAPGLVVKKTTQTISDPVNATSNPKAIPGSEVSYIISVANSGPGSVDDGGLVIEDPIPAGTCIVVGDIAGPGSGPVAFVDGSPSSELSYTFVALGSGVDDVDFSADGGSSFTYVPSANASGCDPAVTDIRINPKGGLAADTGGGSPNAEFSFRVLVN